MATKREGLKMSFTASNPEPQEFAWNRRSSTPGSHRLALSLCRLRLVSRLKAWARGSGIACRVQGQGLERKMFWAWGLAVASDACCLCWGGM